MPDLDAVHRLFRILHAAIGFAGLGLFWVPVLARKGSRLHITSGRLFAGCAYYVALTGLLASVWGLLHPPSFLAGEDLGAMPGDRARLAIERLRFILSITGFLALGVLAGVVLGTRVMKAGPRHEQLRSPLVLVPLGGLLIWSAALALYGLASLVAVYAGWHFIPRAGGHRYWLTAGLGVLGVYGAIGDLRYVRGPCPSPPARWSMHVHCVLGAGAGFYAAFFLFGATRLLPVPGAWPLIAAMLPVVIGSVATKAYISRYERRVGSLPADESHQAMPSRLAVGPER